MTTATIGFHRDFRLSDLHESPLNPRRVYNLAAMEQLAASIKASGIITPLIARPHAKGAEIAAGHRRLRAAALAGVETGPVILREMDDAEFVEVLNIENLQRQDLTALEEADGYKLLMTKAGYTVERIAERVGMSAKYVYDRVKLLELTEPAKKALREDRITAGHAILLARLKPKEQELVMHEDKGGLWEHEYSLEDPDGKGPMRDPLKAKSVKELDAWIDQHIRFDAKAVDPMVFPETAVTLTAAAEQEEKVVKITHDWVVPDTARDEKERTITSRSWERADGKHKSKTCEHSVTGVIVVGPGRGDSFKVCLAKEKCKVHWAQWQKDREKRAAAPAKKATRAPAQDSWEVQQAKRVAAEKRCDAVLPAIYAALADKLKKAPAGAKGPLGKILTSDLRGEGSDYMTLGTTAEDLVRFLAFDALTERPDRWQGLREFAADLKPWGVDVKKFLADHDKKAKAETPATSGPDAKKKGVTKKGKKK